jgi:hypothetical protein
VIAGIVFFGDNSIDDEEEVSDNSIISIGF